MANRFLNNITINDSYTFPNADGTADQIIKTDGSGQLSFIDQDSLLAGSSESTHILVKNTSGAQIAKGTPVYVTGETGNSGKIEIAPADAADEDKMPALGLLETTLNDNSEGYCVQGGLLEALATATIDGTSTTANDTVYVKAGGGLTMTKPTGTNFIQNIAKVARVHASNGSLVVSSILRTNDVPTPLYIDHANQRVGIGIEDPQYPLDFPTNQSGAAIRIGDDNVDSYIMFSRPRGYVGFDADGYAVLQGGPTKGVRLNVNSDVFGSGTALQISDNGNVGIGTTSPAVNFQVGDGTTNTTSRFYYNDNTYTQINGYGLYMSRNVSYIRPTTDNTQNLYIGTNTIQWNTLIIDASTTTFNTNGSENMRVASNGNVGIGTTSPGYKLDVNGTGRFSTTVDEAFVLNSTDDGPIYMAYKRNGDRHAYVGFGGSDDQFSIMNEESAGSILLGTAGSPRVTILESGNVGIGTASPADKLHVEGNIYLGASTRTIYTGGSANLILQTNTGQTIFSRSNGSSESMRIDSSGNVGIGTTSPNAKLSVKSSATNNWVFRATASDGGDLGGIYEDGGTNAELYIKNSAGTSSVLINSNGNSYLTGGNVGIGTTSPSYKLDVNGSLHSTDLTIADYIYHEGDTDTYAGFGGSDYFRVVTGGTSRLQVYTTGTFVNNPLYIAEKIGHTADSNTYMAFPFNDTISWNTNGSERMRINSSGNVGIGTTSPSVKLDVDGGRFRVQDGGDIVLDVNPLTGGFSIGDTAEVGGGAYIAGDGTDIDIVMQGGPAFTFRNSGRLGINDTTPSYRLDVNGTIRATGDVIAYSDIRVKENIKTINNALDKVKSLRGVEYNKIDNPEKSIGVIAQEIEEVIPEVVREDDQGMKSVAYGNITAVLIEAIKEQQKQIDELKSIINGSSK